MASHSLAAVPPVSLRNTLKLGEGLLDWMRSGRQGRRQAKELHRVQRWGERLPDISAEDVGIHAAVGWGQSVLIRVCAILITNFDARPALENGVLYILRPQSGCPPTLKRRNMLDIGETASARMHAAGHLVPLGMPRSARLQRSLPGAYPVLVQSKRRSFGRTDRAGEVRIELRASSRFLLLSGSRLDWTRGDSPRSGIVIQDAGWDGASIA